MMGLLLMKTKKKQKQNANEITEGLILEESIIK